MDRLLFLCSSEHTYNDLVQLTGQYGDNVHVAFSKADDIQGMQSEILKYQPEAIISPPGTARVIRNHTKKPVIFLLPGQIDLINMLEDASQKDSDTIYFLGYELGFMVQEQKSLEKLLKKKIEFFLYDTDEEREIQLKELAKLKIKHAATTSGYAQAELKKRGIDATVLKWRHSSIQLAINTASEVIKQTKRENLFNKWLNATFNNIQDGIIGIQQGVVFMMNSRAGEIFGVNTEEIIDRDIKEIEQDTYIGRLLNGKALHLKQDFIHTIRGRQCVINIVPISSTQSVIIIKDKSDIYRLQASLDKEAHDNGMVARFEIQDVTGTSEEIARCKEVARKYAQYNTPVLLVGESGVGKDRFAHGIHNASSRAHSPFVSINCDSFSEAELNEQLFGIKSTSIVGANKRALIGAFELANRGTLYLSQVSKLPLPIQSKIVHTIQQREIIHTDGNTRIPIDIRIIASDTKDLVEAVKNGQFIKELYYILSSLTIRIPPLRERRDDIPQLIENIVSEANKELKINASIPQNVIKKMSNMNWDDNIHELRSYVTRYLMLSDSKGKLSDFSPLDGSDVFDYKSPITPIKNEDATLSNDNILVNSSPNNLNVKVDSLKKMEKDIILQLSNYYNDTQISDILQIGRSTIWRKVNDK